MGKKINFMQEVYTVVRRGGGVKIVYLKFQGINFLIDIRSSCCHAASIDPESSRQEALLSMFLAITCLNVQWPAQHRHMHAESWGHKIIRTYKHGSYMHC